MYFDCQVITRFIASSCPVIYWFVAMVTLPRLQSSDHSVTTLWEVSRDELCATKHMQYLNFLTCCNTWRSRAIFAYFVLYMFVGVAAFVNFLPWTWIVKAPSQATANQRKKHNVEKILSVACNAFAHNTSIFIRFALVASQICEILRNSPKIRI